MSRPLGCFCGSYHRVGAHAYGCPAEDTRCTCPSASERRWSDDPYYQCPDCERRQEDAEQAAA